jgi:hypothetical protein
MQANAKQAQVKLQIFIPPLHYLFVVTEPHPSMCIESAHHFIQVQRIVECQALVHSDGESAIPDP